MAKHTTHKTTADGKALTLARRQVRASKYAPEATTTRAGRVRPTAPATTTPRTYA